MALEHDLDKEGYADFSDFTGDTGYADYLDTDFDSGETAYGSVAELLSIPSMYLWQPVSTDSALAEAVLLGNPPELEPLNAFRKRKIDLFRSEHPFVVGDSEMLLRLRLRAKMRKAMSVELRF